MKPYPFSALQQFIECAHIPGISMSWCRQGVVKSVAAGVVDTSQPYSVDNSTLFQAASLSKAVSAAIVLNLVKQGRWDLDKPLCEISDYGSAEIKNNPYYKKLTTRMVLAQCSGLPNYSGDNNANFIAEPGTKFTYSGVAFDFLKEVIENKTGKEWESISQEFFHAIGMNHSTFLQSSSIVARAHDGNGCPEPIPAANSPAIPAGSLLTTSSDYIVFLRHCLSDAFLKQTLFQAHTKLRPEDFPKAFDSAHKILWGLGIALFEQDGRKIAFHWGTNPGSYAFAAIDLLSGDCIACFVNSVNGPNVFQKLTELVVGDMSPVFDWLSHYCYFNAAVKPTVPETQINLLLFSKDKSQADVTDEEMVKSKCSSVAKL
ncbi:MAG: serine hydrolase domain-containing protein [Gammaproteobacteria bacterium]